MKYNSINNVGVVIIGRNEGERLRKCFRSLPKEITSVVYVDSDSSDGSVELALNNKVDVLELDLSVPFTAARARNAGAYRLMELFKKVELIQFIDGDCQIFDDWFDSALNVMNNSHDVGAISGRIKERDPGYSAFNRICDIEWRIQPNGEVKSFGGLVMIRTEVFKIAGGYNPIVIAAEDDELSIRIRDSGFKIYRIKKLCALHDANISKIRQWWKRAMRTGHGYIDVYMLHRKNNEKYFQREIKSLFFYGFIIPFFIAVSVFSQHRIFLALVILYPLLFLKIVCSMRNKGYSLADRFLWALSCVVSKFPQFVGVLKYFSARLRKNSFCIIEHK